MTSGSLPVSASKSVDWTGIRLGYRLTQAADRVIFPQGVELLTLPIAYLY